ncbi:MAG: SpoIIE family protein phosphatase [Clostridia bacterium]|nr:SpoIIE family protein phosphatase [Clostridia bacterium]
MPIKINVKSCFLYIIFAACCVFLNGAVSGVPLALCIYFPLLICGGNCIAAPIIYIACSAVHFNLTSFLCALFEAFFPLAITLIYRKTQKKIKYEAAAYMCVTLAPFVIFSDWAGIDIDLLNGSPYIIKGIAAAVIVIFFLFGYRTVYACFFRLGRCRLKEDELVCAAAVYSAIGMGMVNLTGEFAYLVFSSVCIAVFIRIFKSPYAIIFAVCASVPPMAVNLTLTPLTAYILISLFSFIFCRAGRAAVSIAVLAAASAYAYLCGFFDEGLTLTVLRAVTLAVFCMLSAIPSDKALKKLCEKITVKRELTDTAVNRERERTGEKLFKISQAFREIECAFKAMDENTDDTAVKKRIFTKLKESCCSSCARKDQCERSTVYAGFGKLIDAGAAKGKINIIDLPPDITQNCCMPGEVIANLNSRLTEYKRYMAEAENVQSGRILLAEQAQGVSGVLKNCAVELCRKTYGGGEKEQSVKNKLAASGISCPELFINGGEHTEVSAVIVGRVNIKQAVTAIEQALDGPFELKDKLCYDGEKCCYIFCRPPKYDAVFGVAAVRKNGEKASGDTHSVIRINEHRFLMALSDGMGSGEYARKVSRTAISLIEAFYRAEMPEGTVLDTINKLISFSRDERFACIDIGCVNLDTGFCELVKIGSPVAVIMRKGEIKIVESQSLPLGILDNLKPSVATEQLKDGDFLIFMSDGVTGAFNSTPELVEFLQPLKPLNPQNLADIIMKEALNRSGGSAADDMTVLCTRIFLTAAYAE